MKLIQGMFGREFSPRPITDFNLGFRIVREAQKETLIEGLTMYAWWKDGVQYVGTAETTLEKAIKTVLEEHKLL